MTLVYCLLWVESVVSQLTCNTHGSDTASNKIVIDKIKHDKQTRTVSFFGLLE